MIVVAAVLAACSTLLWSCASSRVDVAAQNEIHETISPEQRAKVLAALRYHGRMDLYVTPNIPGRKLANAREFCAVARNHEALALVDATVTGSAKNHLLVTTGGIYIRNDWASYSPGRSFLPYSVFVEGALTGGGVYEASIAGVNFNMAGCGMSKHDLLEMLRDVQASLK